MIKVCLKSSFGNLLIMSNHKGPIEIHLFLIVTTEAIVSIVHTDKLSLLLFVFHIVFKTPELN